MTYVGKKSTQEQTRTVPVWVGGRLCSTQLFSDPDWRLLLQLHQKTFKSSQRPTSQVPSMGTEYWGMHMRGLVDQVWKQYTSLLFMVGTGSCGWWAWVANSVCSGRRGKWIWWMASSLDYKGPGEKFGWYQYLWIRKTRKENPTTMIIVRIALNLY